MIWRMDLIAYTRGIGEFADNTSMVKALEINVCVYVLELEYDLKSIEMRATRLRCRAIVSFLRTDR